MKKELKSVSSNNSNVSTEVALKLLEKVSENLKIDTKLYTSIKFKSTEEPFNLNKEDLPNEEVIEAYIEFKDNSAEIIKLDILINIDKARYLVGEGNYRRLTNIGLETTAINILVYYLIKELSVIVRTRSYMNSGFGDKVSMTDSLNESLLKELDLDTQLALSPKLLFKEFAAVYLTRSVLISIEENTNLL